MIRWRPSGSDRVDENIVNVSPYGVPKDVSDDVIVNKAIKGRTCIYPFRPRGVPHKIKFFKQEYEVAFLEYEESPWEEFLEFIVSYFDERLKDGIIISLPTPWKAYQTAKKLRREFTGRMTITNLKLKGNVIYYGEDPKALVRFDLHTWGQKNLIRSLWSLSLGKLHDLTIFLENRPVDNLVVYERDPSVLFKLIAWDPSLRDLANHELIPKLKDEFFVVRTRGRDIPIRDPTKPLDVEIWPLISYEGREVLLRGFRIIGSHIASFLRYYLMETKRFYRDIDIIARDWKNSKIVVRRITDVPTVRDREIREAFVMLPSPKSLEDIRIRDVRIPLRASSIEMDEVLRTIPREYHEFILAFDINDPEKYSQRYSYISPKVKKDWSLAVSISRAIKARMFRKVSEHTIAHALMNVLSFFDVVCAEDPRNPGKIFVEEEVEEDILNEILELSKKIIKGCSCDEVCMGCAYSPMCLHENRYLDRILTMRAL